MKPFLKLKCMSGINVFQQDEEGWKMNHMIIVLQTPSLKRTYVQYDDRCLTIKEIAGSMGISHRNVLSIVHDKLDFRKVSARCVPRLFTLNQKRKVFFSLTFSVNVEQSMQNIIVNFRIGQKLPIAPKGAILPSGTSFFSSNKARPHTAAITQANLKEMHWDQLEYPAYSPDLSPRDYSLFGPLKKLWEARDLKMMKLNSSCTGRRHNLSLFMTMESKGCRFDGKMCFG
ncbi:hypothetical protein NQ318_022462 [Aromia moschata]|uniref:Transposase n=1 Tax=Aromia moschata TaxID=1265417 RepID=A0AAV8Z569_9CUCU|nr:hypothetical protein NQ318_022462 [Aromia moschata]